MNWTATAAAGEGEEESAAARVPAAPEAAVRQREIAARLVGQAPAHFVPYRGGYLEVPVALVPDSFLLYRADNGRLIAELSEHLRDRGLDWESWRRGQEGRETQQQLHGFLLAKARDLQGPIFQELEQQGQQTEPLLITAEGLVVNGNRRLAAMRELRHRDPRRYAGFAELRVAVLPAETEPAEIEFVEAALQMAPETKLAYGWINRRLKLRRQRDELRLPVEQICAAYRLEGPAQLERELAELALAEDYLESFREEPGHYALVADAETLFVGLREQLAALPRGLRERWRLGGFTLIDGRAAVRGPLDRHFPFAAPLPEQLPSRLLWRFAQERALVGGEEGADEDEDRPLDSALARDLDLILGDRQHSERNAKALFELSEALRIEHAERRAPARILRRIRTVSDMMGRLDPEALSSRQRRQLRADVAALQAQATYLLSDEGASETED